MESEMQIDLLGILKKADEVFSQPQALRGMFETSMIVNSAELYRGPQEEGSYLRSNIYLIAEPGYLLWRLNPHGAGITNYKNDALLSPYTEPLVDFIEHTRTQRQTAAIMPMDLLTLDALKQNGHFHPKSLKYWLGIDKRHVKQRKPRLSK